MKDNLEIEVISDTTVSELEKLQIEKTLKQEYGNQTLVKVRGRKTKNLEFEQNRNAVKNNDLKTHYKEYLTDNYPEIDIDEFLELDGEISKITPNQNDESKRFKLKWISGKNILSFNEVYLELENRGILRIFSEPQNMGGKSNLIRVLKILLFGEFYRSNQERTTLSSIMHKFSPLNTAMVEGEIEIEDKSYLIRRDFTRGVNGKVSQKVTISCDGNLVDIAVFKKLIGDIHQFLFISFFDSFTIEKWLNTKPTERYRMFLNYFGLGSIEDKAKSAKVEYDKFLKTSIVKQYANVNIEDEIKSRKSEIYNLTQTINNNNVQITKLDGEISKKQNEIRRFQNQIKGVPDILHGENENTLDNKIKNLNDNITSLKDKIIQLQNECVVVENNKEDLIAEINNLQIDATKIKADPDLLLELERLTYLLNNYIVNDTLIAKRHQLESEIESLRSKYSTSLAMKKIKETDLSLQPDSITCPNCKVVSDNKGVKDKLIQQIKTLNDDLEAAKNEGLSVKKDLLQLENEIKAAEFDYKREYNRLIGEVTLKIETGKKQVLDEIRNEIFSKQKLLQQINNNEEKNFQITNLQSDIIKNEIEIGQIKEKKKYLVNFQDQIDFNKKLELEINTIDSAVQTLISNKNDHVVEVRLAEKQIELKQREIETFIKNETRVKQELKQDKLFKVYVEVHSKGGLAMKILNDLVEDINADLAVILSHDDFIPFIKIEDDAIEFCFYRDGVEFNMSEGSGYEKTILLLALHYLLLSKMTVPISNIFILDEVFVAVSMPFLDRVYKVVESLLNIFDSILLITHIEQISQWCDDNIKLIKNNNISKIV